MTENDFPADDDSQSASRNNAIFDTFPQSIKNIVANLRIVIDQIGLDSKQARELILEIARQLDEGRLCERNQISRKIKKILKDKIQEGKVTGKWIEECLPQEYKRQYIKSELSSLSKERPKRQLIEVSTAGNQIAEQQEDKSVDQLNEGQPTHKIDCADTVKQQGVLLRADEVGELLRENEKLKEALLRQTSIRTADRIHATEFEFTIPKEMYEMVKDAMDRSKSVIFVRCDENKNFLRAEPDVYN